RDASLRASFVARVLAYARWKAALAAGMTGARLAAFHAAHEPQLRAHHPTACRRLGALVANAGKRPLRAVVADYSAGSMEARRRPLDDRPQRDQRRHDQRLGGREARLEDDEAPEAELRHAERREDAEHRRRQQEQARAAEHEPARQRAARQPAEPRLRVTAPAERRHLPRAHVPAHEPRRDRSEERQVGKECTTRWDGADYRYKHKSKRDRTRITRSEC